MKFAIACYLKLAEELKNPTEHNFGIMLTSDEEVGGQNGTKFLLNNFGGSASKTKQFAFLPDGCAGESIESEAKGVWHIEATARGISTHASRPWEGENAIKKLVDFLHELKTHVPGKPCEDKKHHHNTLNIGKIQGGEAVNKVPHKAVAELDIRHIPEISKKELRKIVEKIAKKHKTHIRELVYASPIKTNLGDRRIKRFENIWKEATGKRLKHTLSHGASDARYFQEHDIPVLLVQPKGGEHHTEHEWVSIKGLKTYYDVLKKWVNEIAT